MCPKFLYLRYSVVFIFLPFLAGPGSQLKYESPQLQSQMLVISLLSLFPSR